MVNPVISNTTRASAFPATLTQIIPPNDSSDRTAFRRVAGWLGEQCDAEEFGPEIFPYVPDLAREAAGPDCRKPAAVFMSLLKKKLNYHPGGTKP